MPQLTRHYCTRCKESVFNCLIDGKRVPTLIYIVVGIPDDVGEFDVNGEGVKTTSFTRELMQTEVARIELCEKCFAAVFGLALVTAQDDEMYDANNSKIPRQLQLEDPSLARTEKMARMHARSLHAIAVGRGDATVDDLELAFRAPPSEQTPVIARPSFPSSRSEEVSPTG